MVTPLRVLITGGAGYLGSVLAPHLAHVGYAVTVLDNLRYGQVSLGMSPDIRFVNGDARDERVMRMLVREHDVLVPLACLVGAPLCDRLPDEARSTNFEAVKMLDRLRSRDQLVLFPTTNSGYGTKSGDVHCTEETPLEPISLYGRTKVDAERLLLESGNAITFRLATVFGRGKPPREMRLDLLVNDFTHRALRDRRLKLFEPHFTRNYVGIRDVARVFAHGIEYADQMVGRPYNVGLPDENISKEELARRIQRFVPDLLVELGDGEDPDKRNYVISNDRILATGFVFQHGLDEGIREVLEWSAQCPHDGGALVRNV